MEKWQATNRLIHIRNSLLMGFAADVLFHQPDAAKTLRGFVLEIGDIAFPLAQIGGALEREDAREQVCLEFRKLVVRSSTAEPFEIVEKYAALTKQMDRLESAPWYAFAKLVRNAIRHGSVVLTPYFQARLPISYRDVTITANDAGRSLDRLISYATAVRLVDEIMALLRDDLT